MKPEDIGSGLSLSYLRNFKESGLSSSYFYTTLASYRSRGLCSCVGDWLLAALVVFVTVLQYGVCGLVWSIKHFSLKALQTR